MSLDLFQVDAFTDRPKVRVVGDRVKLGGQAVTVPHGRLAA